MIEYLMNSILCLGLFWLFYELLLSRENLGHFKRFFLLAGIAFSLILPALSITFFIPELYSTQISEINNQPGDPIESSSSFSYTKLFIVVYLLVLLFFLIRCCRNLIYLLKLISKSEHIHMGKYQLVLLENEIAPHTFLNYIFICRHKFQQNQINAYVLEHEKTHARQWHTLDLLLIELCICIFWFNPFLHLIKRSIRLNHEFLADQYSITYLDTVSYQKILLKYIQMNPVTPQLTHSINYLITKKRLKMMTKKTTKSTAICKMLLSVFLFAFAAAIFPKVNFAQETATQEELEKYIKIVEKNYNPGSQNISLRGSDAEDVNSIFPKLTQEQKDYIKSKNLPVIGPPPPPPPPPPIPSAPKALAPPSAPSPPAPPRSPQTQTPPATTSPPNAPKPPNLVAPPSPSATTSSSAGPTRNQRRCHLLCEWQKSGLPNR